MDDTDIDVDRELGGRELSDPLPWDVINAGVRKGYLKAEWRRAINEAQTDDCKWGHCYRCGIPGDGADTRLARPDLPGLGALADASIPPEATAPRQLSAASIAPANAEPQQARLHKRYRFTFQKTGDARFLSHRQLMDALERAMRAAAVPIRYTEGFNPHIRLSMGPALALGHEGRSEVFDADCTAPVRRHHLDRANQLLPEGVDILEASPLLPGAPSLGKSVVAARYRIMPRPDSAPWPESPAGLPESLQKGVRSWRMHQDGILFVDLNARQALGPTPSVKQLLEGLGLTPKEVSRIAVTRERLVTGAGHILPPVDAAS